MGLFSALFKKEKGDILQRGLVDFLNDVDGKYMESYATKSTKKLRDVMSEDCLYKVASWIYQYNVRYFSTDKFRTTTWTKVGIQDGFDLIRKDVTFSKVKVAGDIRMGLADDYSEIWLVDCANSKRLVLDISSV